MSLAIKSFYEFGPFVLDPEERVLLRDGVPVPMTPKVFDTLLLLIQNQGRTVSKEEMFDVLWRDSFVEESNLTFNIRKLRQALGDERGAPKYIETIPKRGYRFKFEVKEVLQEMPVAPAPEIRFRDVRVDDEANINKEIFLNALNALKKEDAPLLSLQTFEKPQDIEPPAAIPVSAPPKNKRPIIFAACFGLLVIATVFIFWLHGKFWGKPLSLRSDSSAPILSAAFKLEKLTNTGTVNNAAISPDGKFMAYSNCTGDMCSLWLRDLTTGENIQIVTASKDIYLGLVFSHDGQWIYFVRAASDTQFTALYRASSRGGIPTKITAHTQGLFSLSPDDRRISFVRCYYKDEDYCSLYVADSNGENEQTLITRQKPIRIGDNQFSPDGKTIAFASGQSRNASVDFGLFEFNIENKTERPLTAHKFFNIKQIQWLPDGKELFFDGYGKHGAK